ncbi:MAG: hypothetical protein JNM69_00465 [Archangium sp.]|nr:hypothetical protein [Archangium sp.]
MPASAQARFLGKPLLVAGLVERQQGAELLLQTDERGFFVRFWLRSDAGSLQRGQLVAVTGIVSTVDKDAPALRECELSWLGDRPDSRPDERQTIIAAASAALCAAADREREFASTKLPASHPIAREERALTERLERQAHAVLGGSTPLACEHPLVSLARSCPWPALFSGEEVVEGGRVFRSKPTLEDLERGSECSTAQVKAVLERLHLREP